MATIDTVYHYYLSTYANSTVSRYDSHKKSELRDIYNQMVKTNKESPLYKIQNSKDVAKFAIDVKENARRIKNVISSLSAGDTGIESAFSKKVASSTDDSIIEARYIGTNGNTDSTEDFEIEVRQLAQPQINMGNFLLSNAKDIPVGSYSFDLNMSSVSFEFQFNVNEGETNRNVQDKLARLIKSANIGLKAKVIENDDGQSALQLESARTGLNDGEDKIFDIIPEGTTTSYVATQLLGIHQITSPANNASFSVNGVEHTAYSNTVTIDQTFELTLKDTTAEGESETIGYKTSVDAVADNLQELVDSYNSIIDIATNHRGEKQQGDKLLADMRNVPMNYRSELESIGLRTQDDGRIYIDKALLADAVTSEDSKENFKVLNAFKNALNERATAASINPMNYVNKIVVAYKNPGHNFATPYISSLYAGMMMDRYC
ncbi:MAG: flagellar filament capping protein FliD [Lachnospiraceae bacterium]|nr:flagellar filament capping protein FliD [Lachnospiraceae bacterium]